MANKTERPIIGSPTPFLKMRVGNFITTGGSGAVGSTSETWFKVVRTAAGSYTLTFDDRFFLFLKGTMNVIVTGGFGSARIDAVSVVNNKHQATLITAATSGGSAADLAAGAIIMFEFFFKDSVAQ